MSVFPPTVKVVISSANLIEEDWDEWSQCIWTQDFFNLRDGETGVAAKRLDLEFRTQLITFLKRCECPEDRIFNLLRGIFFRNVRVRLVASVPGFFHSSSMEQFGHLRLRAILASLREFETAVGLEGKLPPILSLSSSMGSPSANWLRSILASCHGRNALPADVSNADAVHLVYPTVSYVQSSRIGPDMAGSLLFHARTYQSKSFPKKCLKRYKDVQGREGCLPHAKYCRCGGNVGRSDECADEESSTSSVDLRRESQFHAICVGSIAEEGYRTVHYQLRVRCGLTTEELRGLDERRSENRKPPERADRRGSVRGG